jgi:hypothetical protein
MKNKTSATPQSIKKKGMGFKSETTLPPINNMTEARGSLSRGF